MWHNNFVVRISVLSVEDKDYVQILSCFVLSESSFKAYQNSREKKNNFISLLKKRELKI
jgi:hypothetical protein